MIIMCSITNESLAAAFVLLLFVLQKCNVADDQGALDVVQDNDRVLSIEM
jgi:hypothetical protein